MSCLVSMIHKIYNQTYLVFFYNFHYEALCFAYYKPVGGINLAHT